MPKAEFTDEDPAQMSFELVWSCFKAHPKGENAEGMPERLRRDQEQ